MSKIDRARNRKSIFIGAAPPESTFHLFKKVSKEGIVAKETIMALGSRNAAQDLTSLKLAKWNQGGLEINPIIGGQTKIEDIFKEAVGKSTTIGLLSKILENYADISRLKIGELLSIELDRQWKPSSARRYVNGIYRYWEFITGGR